MPKGHISGLEGALESYWHIDKTKTRLNNPNNHGFKKNVWINMRKWTSEERCYREYVTYEEQRI